MDTQDSGYSHPTGDEALTCLSNMAGALGQLVKAYPGAREPDNSDWLDAWFRSRIQRICDGQLRDIDAVLSSDAPLQVPTTTAIARPLRIVSLRPHYFRGFRVLSQPISIQGDLVVIDGPNSSGKTSLAEALEWLFTGSLSRRENQESGHAREFENCVENQFRPREEQTWVEASFAIVGDEQTNLVKLKRVLVQDYGTTGTSTCESALYVNDCELDRETEHNTLDNLIASVPPLLMQHTLRLFVESNPAHRRHYFERLLRLDELTNLISRAVIGDDRLREFPSPVGSEGLARWVGFATMLTSGQSRTAHGRCSHAEAENVAGEVRGALAAIAMEEFPDLVPAISSHEQIRTILDQAQQRRRQESFPLLDQLRPRRVLSDEQASAIYGPQATAAAESLRDAWEEYERAREAGQAMGEQRLEIARAVKILIDATVIDLQVAAQHCPICAYELVQTLSRERITEIRGWTPVSEREGAAKADLMRNMGQLIYLLRSVLQEHDELFPSQPDASELEHCLADAGQELRGAVTKLVKVREAASDALGAAESRARFISEASIEAPCDQNALDSFINNCLQTVRALEGQVPQHARAYCDALRNVDSVVGTIARVDPNYRLREEWIACADIIIGIADALRWERAKRTAQKDLQRLRDQLIDYRKCFLEDRRVAFNEGMQEVWSALRKDRYSAFSKLHIPPPRSRGFPVEIEVKAVLDDGTNKQEVDALRVFSESQVNALGIAAFVTRSRLLGHRMLIFDDPVQSMDEDHFKTFARDVIPHALGQRFQVILLTHNDTFARDVSYWHYDRPGYITMAVRHSRRKGCVVQEGNRRVAERLKIAESLAEAGKLEDAWRFVRLAVERLYVVVYAKYGSADFQPESWQNQTAEHMWTSGAGPVIECLAPCAGKKLKEILELSVAGAHDKAARGETEIKVSTTFIRSLLETLGVGG